MREHSAPYLVLRFGTRLELVPHPPQTGRILKPHTASAPLSILGGDILSDEYNPGRPPDQSVLAGIGFGGDQRKQSAAIWRGHRYPPITRLKLRIEGQIESKPIQVKSQTLILISNINVDRVNTEVEAMPGTIVRAARGRISAHRI